MSLIAVSFSFLPYFFLGVPLVMERLMLLLRFERFILDRVREFESEMVYFPLALQKMLANGLLSN